MANLNYTNNKMQINAGLHANTFRREHRQRVASAEIMPAGYGPNHLVYDNAGYKREFSAFLKYFHEIVSNLSLFADIQFRTADFRYVGKDQPILRDTFNIKPISWAFLNPKIGVRYQIRKELSSYLGWGKTTREPTRLDMFSGADRATYTIDLSLVKPETVSNFEMGLNYRSKKTTLNINAYRMDFRNEIAATGELNPQGWPIRRNAGTSFRSGIELDWQQQILINKLYLLGNATFSHNRIKEFRQFYDVYDEANNFIRKEPVIYRNVNPFLTPTITFNTALNWQPNRWLSSEISTRYISSAFLDNTNDELMTTGDYWVLDLRLTLKLASLFASSHHNTDKEYNLSFQFNNITSTKFTPSGYTYSYYTEYSDGTKKLNRNAYYYPSALVNYFVTFSCKL
jgi:iron complex outermembrane receptor protein